MPQQGSTVSASMDVKANAQVNPAPSVEIVSVPYGHTAVTTLPDRTQPVTYVSSTTTNNATTVTVVQAPQSTITVVQAPQSTITVVRTTPAAVDRTDIVEIQRPMFHLGVSTITVERLARERGCTGGRGAGLLTAEGPVEVYRMVCDTGAVFLAKCDLRQCSPMKYTAK